MQLESFEQTVDEMIAELESQGKKDVTPEDCPYFGHVWAAALGLAEELLTLDLNGKRVLEVGCGLALPSIVAAKLGAKVMALDIHKDVGAFIAANLAANELKPDDIKYVCTDWQHFDRPIEGFDYVIASDVLYENHHPKTLVAFLKSLLAINGEALIVDPCRWHHQDFIKALQDANFDVELNYRWTKENDQPVKLAAIKAKLKGRVVADNTTR